MKAMEPLFVDREDSKGIPGRYLDCVHQFVGRTPSRATASEQGRAGGRMVVHHHRNAAFGPVPPLRLQIIE